MSIQVGILGNASIARRSLIPAFSAHPDFELIGVASRSGDVSYADMVARDDVDLIYCPLPTGLHYEWVMKALKAGKHVLCEKSLACTSAEVEDLVNMARDQGRLLMESFQFKFHPQNLHVKELLAGNAIGELRQMVVRFGIPPFPEGEKNIRYYRELGGGALLDNGAYTIKATTYLLGNDVKVLAAVQGGGTIVGASPDQAPSVDITGALMLMARYHQSSGRKTQNLELGTCSPRLVPVQTAYGFDHFYQCGYEIWGTEGKITTTRAFTAREGFEAPVILETKAGRVVKTFNADHFARLLDYVSSRISSNDFETEYAECQTQANLIEAAQKCMV